MHLPNFMIFGTYKLHNATNENEKVKKLELTLLTERICDQKLVQSEPRSTHPKSGAGLPTDRIICRGRRRSLKIILYRRARDISGDIPGAAAPVPEDPQKHVRP